MSVWRQSASWAETKKTWTPWCLRLGWRSYWSWGGFQRKMVRRSTLGFKLRHSRALVTSFTTSQIWFQNLTAEGSLRTSSRFLTDPQLLKFVSSRSDSPYLSRGLIELVTPLCMGSLNYNHISHLSWVFFLWSYIHATLQVNKSMILFKLM